MQCNNYSHLDWTSPSRVALHMTSPPTWLYRNSKRHLLKKISGMQWPQVLSIGSGSYHPVHAQKTWNKEGKQMKLPLDYTLAHVHSLDYKNMEIKAKVQGLLRMGSSKIRLMPYLAVLKKLILFCTSLRGGSSFGHDQPLHHISRNLLSDSDVASTPSLVEPWSLITSELLVSTLDYVSRIMSVVRDNRAYFLFKKFVLYFLTLKRWPSLLQLFPN